MESKFNTLLKDLIIISSDKEEQLDLIGNGNVGTEMLINFGISYKNLNRFLEQKLLNQNQKEKLDQFQNYINDDANLDDNLESEQWKKTRIIAKEVVKSLNSNHFKVYLDKSGKFWEAKLVR